MKIKKSLLSGFAAILFSTSICAAEDLGQARLFLGSTKTSPSELNTELTAQGLKTADLNNTFGLEITFPTYQYLQLGLRYSYHVIGLDEDPSADSTDYTAALAQQSMLGIARVPLYKTDIVHFDAFVGAGVIIASEYKIKTATQDGSLKKGTTPNLAAGASMSIGYKQYFFTIEAGYEYNMIDGFSSSGTINSNVSKIDLSGSYLTIGLMFDGIPIYKK